MKPETRERLETSISPDALVVDVGGGASPLPRADYVIDGIQYEARGLLDRGATRGPERFSAATWRQLDLCARRPWPFPDKFFDFAVCSHLLEDVRDPIWVCSELSRIAKAGYVETPSRFVEQSLGVEHPWYAGFYHHRWLVSLEGDVLCFRHKPHSLHVIRDAIVANLGPSSRISPTHENLSLWWVGELNGREVLCFDEAEVNDELCAFAREARRGKDLTVAIHLPFVRRLRRGLFFHKLKWKAPR